MEDVELIESFVQGIRDGRSVNMIIHGDSICFFVLPEYENSHVIARRTKNYGVDYFVSNSDCSDEERNCRKAVLNKLKGNILYMKGVSIMYIDCNCRVCKGKFKNQLKFNKKRIQTLKMKRKITKEQIIKNSYTEKILWFEEQNRILEPIVVVDEL